MGIIKEVPKPYRQVEKIESLPKLDVSIFRKKGNSKTFKGWMISKINDARKIENHDLVQVLYSVLEKYKEFNEPFNPKQWKGKSSVSFIEKPDLIISVRYRKEEPDSEPKEVRMELLKTDINRLLLTISGLNQGDWIKTRDIAEKYYGQHWKSVFSDRTKHPYLVEMFNYLEYKGKIKYSRSGKIWVLNQNKNSH